MRRLLAATLVALLVGSVLPMTALAAAPVAQAVTVDDAVEDQQKVITLRAESTDDSDVTSFDVGTPGHGSLGTVGAVQCDAGSPKVCTADVTYTPDGDYFGSDSFTYTATTDAPSDAATVSITVAAVNDTPAADAKAITVDEDSVDNPVTLSGTDPDGDTLTYAIVSQPAHGDVTGTGAARLYTPDPNYAGPDSFTYTVDDGTATSPAATVSVSVTGIADLDARNDAVAIKATTTSTLDLFKANGGSADSAGPGKTTADLVITAVTKPSKGTVTITPGGKTVVYDPTGCSVGSDKFSYTMTDGVDTDTADVAVTINRPGAGGVSTSPITDTPGFAFVTNSTFGSTIPLKVSWCGITTSSTSVRSHKLQQSTNGSSYSTLILSTTAKSSTRALRLSTDYRWRVRTVDTAGRTGSYRSSSATRIRRAESTSTSITYSGTWGTSTAGSPSGGSQRYTTQAGASASFTLTNRQRFAIIGAKSSSRGSFRIYVDNVYLATASAKTSSTTVNYRRVLYHRALTSGTGVSHTIRIEAVGNGRVDFDAILTLGAP